MDSINYSELYTLQDEVMEIVFACENIFYLTGGTCLSRFYQAKRYSDDLDFFTHDARAFYRAVREIKIALSKAFKLVEEVSSKDFVRLRIDNRLQVDFVHDRVMRFGELCYLDNGYIIDNCENILANKFTAVMGRDSAKDIFDIYLIDKYYTYDYQEILKIAHQKAEFRDDDLLIRLKSFPLSLLKSIILIDKNFLDSFEQEFVKTIAKIEESIDAH